jgi:hypothetical protein
MEIGQRVTAEILSHGKPEKIHGTIVSERSGVYEIKPEGFDSLTIEVPSSHVHAKKPEGIIKPKLDYKKK